MLEFVADQLYLIAVGVFAAVSFVVIRRSYRRRLASGMRGVAGLRTAAIASIVPVVVLALLLMTLGWLLRGMFYTYPGSPPPPPADPVKTAVDNLVALLTIVAIPVVTFLAVLDLYAIRPPQSEGRSEDAVWFAVFGTMFSLILYAGALGVSTVMYGSIDAAARRDAEAASTAQREAEADAQEARSSGLSIEVAVGDAVVEPSTEHGSVLTRLVLDVTVRSATAIELSEGPRGIRGGQLSLYNDAGYFADITEGIWLPGRIPAGFESTYRLVVPTAWSCPTGARVYVAEACDVPDSGGPELRLPVTGPWEATLMFSNDVPFDDPRHLGYSTTTDFSVDEKP